MVSDNSLWIRLILAKILNNKVFLFFFFHRAVNAFTSNIKEDENSTHEEEGALHGLI